MAQQMVWEEAGVHIEKESVDCKEKQAVQEGEIADHEPEEKIIEAEVQKLTEMKLRSPVKTAPASAVHATMNGNSPKNNTSVDVLPKSNGSHSPETDKKLVPKCHSMERKHHYPSGKSHYEDDDNWSLSSSTATSARTAKITVPAAPRFTCVDRLQRRKEFYSKLEEKHKALEKEKFEYEARVKEEDQAALKLMRKNMSYKANPVPSFYREGPPVKAELKKIPVTRPKSPNLSRRRSHGDADATRKSSPSPQPGSGTGRGTARHSMGTNKEAKGTPSPLSSKDKAASPSSNGSSKVMSR